MKSNKILIKLIYDKANVPVVEQIDFSKGFSLEKLIRTVDCLKNKGFNYICIENLENTYEIIEVINYLVTQTDKLEIDLSESLDIDMDNISKANNDIYYKVNSNTEFRKLLNRLKHNYNATIPEEIIISNYDELINNKYIRKINISNSDFFFTQELLMKLGCKVNCIEVNNLEYSIDEYLQVLDEVEKIQKIATSNNQLNRFMTVYSYLVNTINYDNSSINSDNLKGALCEKKCICAGYVEALSLLLKKVDIECNEVYGNTKEVEGLGFPEHVWNQVKIDGEWYNCDVTWDSMQRYSAKNYEYCLVSDSQFKNHYSLRKNQLVHKCYSSYSRKDLHITMQKHRECDIYR